VVKTALSNVRFVPTGDIALFHLAERHLNLTEDSLRVGDNVVDETLRLLGDPNDEA
jgi:hypothetical protein